MWDSLLAILLLATLPFAVLSSDVADCGVKNNTLKFGRHIIVDRHGEGHYRSVQEAVNSVPSGNNRWARIVINPGIYMEQLTIPGNKPCIFLDGSNRHLVTITFNKHSQTDTSATFSSYPKNVVIRGITFKNSYNVYGTKATTQVKQALAARVYGDKSIFYECGFIGVQDTLWDVTGRHYYHSCYIEGAVDFIFGGGQSYFEDCMINATVSLPPHHITKGYVTAQGRSSPGDSSGFVFRRGTVVGARNVFLGRAYGPYSRVIFHETLLSAGVAPEGWDAWQFKGNEARITYAEVGCKGRGSNMTSRVRWAKRLDSLQMDKFSMSAFIDQEGWLASHPVSNKFYRNRRVA
ncbi:hypothetical protein MLD38_015610 [Melastoma candidum]|uniref:Uncharacterized protein n=1 Tax=Melastoma candidum TaxID=119954 RepID=A0ACB9RGJ8_9MYRT|nr:hypothetical protein MLD38_015610 [Melastoma candidum]